MFYPADPYLYSLSVEMVHECNFILCYTNQVPVILIIMCCRHWEYPVCVCCCQGHNPAAQPEGIQLSLIIQLQQKWLQPKHREHGWKDMNGGWWWSDRLVDGAVVMDE